jgi:N-methylhydantoinase B
MTNTSNLPVEALEVEYPLTVLRYELVDGSGGAGRARGGMGLRRVYRAEAECHLRLDGSRLLAPPWGLEGANPAGVAISGWAPVSSPSSTVPAACAPGRRSKSSHRVQAAMASPPSAIQR